MMRVKMYIMKKIAIRALPLLAMISPTAVNAEPSANAIVKMLDAGGDVAVVAEYSLQSYYDAFLWSNAYVERQTENRGHIYCAPRTMVMQKEQARSIFEEYVKEHPEEADKPTGLIVLLALQATFPCE